MTTTALKLNFQGGVGRVIDGSLPDGTYDVTVEYAEVEQPVAATIVVEPTAAVFAPLTDEQAAEIGMTAAEANALNITAAQVDGIKAARAAQVTDVPVELAPAGVGVVGTPEPPAGETPVVPPVAPADAGPSVVGS